MQPPSYLSRLKDAIRATYGCEALHATSIDVAEPEWQGAVEVFLVEHPATKRCYAWAENDNGRLYITTVLGIAPITNARLAVQAMITAKKGPTKNRYYR